MAEPRNIKVKLTVDTSEFMAAIAEIRKAIADLPSLNVKAERVEEEDKPE